MRGRDGEHGDGRPAGEGAVKAVVMAAGRGSRMQAAGGEEPPLETEQRRWANRGRKTLIPFHGQPFLAHLLGALADGGIQEVCVVVGPGDDPVARFLERHEVEVGFQRLQVAVAVQEVASGSAHALLAARAFAGEDPVLVVNADNLYPPPVVEAVRRLEGDATAGFRARALVEEGGIEASRISAFALLEAGTHGCLVRIVEKPGPEVAAGFGPNPMVSMTCWRFTPAIFEACRRVAPSLRGEHELPDAVRLRIREEGACVHVLPVEAAVLDLTRRADIPRVEARLRGREVRL